jgi:septal ring factor EnvC (AmiA/AmiB activator)
MQMNAAFKEKLSKYKSTVNAMKLTIIVLCALVATLFYFGINKNNASNYASAKETVIDEYTSWEEELTKKEQELKQREEEIKKIESDLEIHN